MPYIDEVKELLNEAGFIKTSAGGNWLTKKYACPAERSWAATDKVKAMLGRAGDDRCYVEFQGLGIKTPRRSHYEGEAGLTSLKARIKRIERKAETESVRNLKEAHRVDAKYKMIVEAMKALGVDLPTKKCVYTGGATLDINGHKINVNPHKDDEYAELPVSVSVGNTFEKANARVPLVTAIAIVGLLPPKNEEE